VGQITVEAKANSPELPDPVASRPAVHVVVPGLAGTGVGHHEVSAAVRERLQNVVDEPFLDMLHELAGPDEVDPRCPSSTFMSG
jgi:hypothetical protein